MRSFATRAAMAAILVSTSLTGALAAGTPYAAQTQPMHAQPAARAAMAPAYRPRLTHIMNEIHAADHRMAVDHKRGYLNAAEFRALENRSNAIRTAALHVAKQHEGALPAANYENLQHRVAQLNRSIHTYATNRA